MLALPKIIGHRGAAGHAPENTLVSLRKAAELGANWVEFDVKLTRDGELVLFHDDTLDRTTDGAGTIAGHSLAELQALDAGGWYGKAFAGERIPTLGAALDTAAELGLGCNIEVKPSEGREDETARAVARALAARSTAPPLLMSSLWRSVLEILHDERAEIPRGFVVHEIPDDWRAVIERTECISLHAGEWNLDADKAAMVHAADVRLLAFTVNTKRQAEKLFAMGVDGVFSDFPDRIF